MFYISDFPTSIQDCIHHCLTIVKPDLHLDDLYPMDDVVAVAKFLLTGSALHSSIPNSLSCQQRPQQQLCYSQPVASIPSFNPALAMKVESNFAAHPPVCGFCAESGHWIRTCSTCLEYINSGKVVRGSTGRLCLPDGSDIPRVLGGRCLKDGIDHALATRQSATASSSSFSRDQLLMLALTFFLYHMTHPLFWKLILPFSPLLHPTRIAGGLPMLLIQNSSRISPKPGPTFEQTRAPRKKESMSVSMACTSL